MFVDRGTKFRWRTFDASEKRENENPKSGRKTPKGVPLDHVDIFKSGDEHQPPIRISLRDIISRETDNVLRSLRDSAFKAASAELTRRDRAEKGTRGGLELSIFYLLSASARPHEPAIKKGEQLAAAPGIFP